MSYEEILEKVKDKSGRISGNRLKFLDETAKEFIINSTKFLNADVSLRERLYCLSINKTCYDKCAVCDNLVTNFTNGKYSDYCSLSCSNKSPITKNKRTSTSIEKYGVENPFQDENIKQKIKDTNLAKYGAENPSQNLLVRNKISATIKNTFKNNRSFILDKRKETCTEKYGVESFSKTPDFLDKVKSTNIEKYGVNWRQESSEWKNNVKRYFIEKYGVENPFQDEGIKQKIKDTNLAKYGVENPSQCKTVQDKKINTSLKQHGVQHFSQKHFSDDTLSILDNKDALLQYCISTPNPHQGLGINKTTLHRYLQKYDIKELVVKKHTSAMEIYISNFIKELGFTVINGVRSLISPYEIDIYIPELQIAIECNGAYWHSELNGKDKNYHLNKTNLCEKIGVSLIHIFDYEYLNFTDIVLSRILSKLGKSAFKSYARKLKTCVVNKEDEIKFLNATHIQQYTNSSVCYGLKSDNSLLAVMSFKKSRYNKNYEWELLRYSSIGNCVGGMGKLFNLFLKEYNPKSIITYADIRWNTGKSYESIGFSRSDDSLPGYYYTKDYKILENRLKYQKHKLPNMLSDFDPGLTEWENMQNNGYDRIWDCGNKVFTWRNNE